MDNEVPPIVLVPSRIDSEGRSVYPEDVLTLIPDLAEQGVAAVFADPASERVYERLRGLESELLVPFAISLGASGTWAALAAFVNLKRDRLVKISANRTRTSANGERSETMIYEGPASGAEDALRDWNDAGRDPDSS